LFNEFVATNPTITPEVLETAKHAFAAYLTKNLSLLDSELPPSQYQNEVEKTYATILNGGALPGNEKAGDDEAKVKMHIKTAASAAKVITQAEARGSVDPAAFAESFYNGAQDLILPYLDALKGASVNADDHSIFTKLTKRYEERFLRDMRDLNVLDPTELTRVTEYGDEIAAFVERIVKNNFGYATKDGSVYFDINAFEAAGLPYARLEPWSRSDNKLAAEGEGSLASKSTEKRGASDFALWKSSKPGEPSWSSSWGKGRPGWHIECSAMASARLGKQMDIHSGGIDLAFPHHDNELAQSEAYWHGHGSHDQWVNYFLHMGHLSIQGSKMSKSLKNFTTIREALDRKDWTPRSLRIVFLLGGWKEGVEITDDLVRTGSSWEEKVNNFFLKVKDLATSQSSGTETAFAADLEAAKKAVNDQLCDSFNTPAVMQSISELISKFNIVDKASVPAKDILAAGQWVTSMVNIFGLNGTSSADSNNTEIGWSGIDIPVEAKPYLYPLAAIRDTLREAARSSAGITAKDLEEALARTSTPQEAPESAKPYADIYTNFRAKVASLESSPSQSISKDVLSLCDRVRDIDLFDVGVYLEDRENQPALVRPVTQEMLKARAEKEARATQKLAEKKKQEQEALKKAEKGKLSHLEMFRTNEYSAWDEEGIPLRDAAGEEITKSRSKKLRKEWTVQKKAHEAWLATQAK
jgi:cysteinyl-tRNA synthetase